MGYVYVAMTVLLTVASQFLIKWQVNAAGAAPEDLTGKLSFLASLVFSPWIITALASAFGASLFWMLAMTKLDLSQAYPFTAAQFVLVVFGGAWLFAEPMSFTKAAGVGLIVIGVTLTGWK